MALKDQILDDVKAAMRAGEKTRLVTLRMLTAAIKQHEVDSRTAAEDADTLRIVEKLVKQRREAADNIARPIAPTSPIKNSRSRHSEAYLPEPLDDAALDALIDEVSRPPAQHRPRTWARS